MLSTPLEERKERNAALPRKGPSRRVRWSRSRVHRRRRILGVLAAVFGVFFLWLAISLGGALTNPALGSSMGARAAEWLRGHGGASIVVWTETQWYSHHQPKVGGSLAAGTIRKPRSTPTTTPGIASVPHLPAPSPLAPFASPAVVGEGSGRRSAAR